MTFSIGKERLTAIYQDGNPMGYITFPRVRAGLVNISQVVTYPEYRDQNVPEKMMERLLCHLEESHQKAALTCPYAQQYMEKHPQWKHILPGQMHFTTH